MRQANTEGLGSQLAALAHMPDSGLSIEQLPYSDHVRPETMEAVGSNVLYFTIQKAPEPLMQDTLSGRPVRVPQASTAMEQGQRIHQQPHRARRVGLSVLSSRLHSRGTLR